jgi:hypothetical protein
VLGLRCGVTGGQLLDAPSLLLGLIEHRLRFGERGFGSAQLHFEAHRIDAIEHVARLHVGALLERALQHDAGNARAHLGDPSRSDSAGELADIGSWRRLQCDHAYLRRCRRLFGLRLVACG